eukprot:9508494-Lingulodinium_polyedra.AAC.1
MDAIFVGGFVVVAVFFLAPRPLSRSAGIAVARLARPASVALTTHRPLVAGASGPSWLAPTWAP